MRPARSLTRSAGASRPTGVSLSLRTASSFDRQLTHTLRCLMLPHHSTLAPTIEQPGLRPPSMQALLQPGRCGQSGFGTSSASYVLHSAFSRSCITLTPFQVFSGYYAIYANEADEKVLTLLTHSFRRPLYAELSLPRQLRKFRSVATVEMLRTTWEKTSNPYVRRSWLPHTVPSALTPFFLSSAFLQAISARLSPWPARSSSHAPPRSPRRNCPPFRRCFSSTALRLSLRRRPTSSSTFLAAASFVWGQSTTRSACAAGHARWAAIFTGLTEGSESLSVLTTGSRQSVGFSLHQRARSVPPCG